MEINDPWLADIVRRASAGEKIIDTVDFSLEPQSNDADSNEEKVEGLAEIICQTDDAAAALFVLMGTLETPEIRNYSRTWRSTWPSLAAVS